MTGMGDPTLEQMDHVVWNVTFWDVEGVLFRDDPDEDITRTLRTQGRWWVSDYTEPTVTDAALAVGLSLDSCSDEDEVHGVRYYEWRLRVPQVEHCRTTTDGVPVLVKQMQGVIADLLPQAQSRWEFSINTYFTWWNYLESAVREDYSVLLTPLEAAFRERLPSDEEVGWQDAMQVRSWWSIDTTEFCTTEIPVGDVLGGGQPSAWLEIGMRPTEATLTHPQWANLVARGFDSTTLFTPIPRPRDELLVVRAHGYTTDKDQTFEWFGHDDASLAHEVLEAHTRYWFHLWSK